MDPDTEVYQRITVIEGFVGTLVLLIDGEDAVEPAFRSFVQRMSVCTGRAKRAVIAMRPEHEIRDRVRELVDAAGQAVEWCHTAGSSGRRPCSLSEQIHRDAIDLERELGGSAKPLA